MYQDFVLWRGNPVVAHYEVLIDNEPILCWFDGTKMIEVLDFEGTNEKQDIARYWTIEDDIYIRLYNPNNRSEEEEAKAKQHVNRLRAKESIKAIQKNNIMRNIEDKVNKIISAAN